MSFRFEGILSIPLLSRMCSQCRRYLGAYQYWLQFSEAIVFTSPEVRRGSYTVVILNNVLQFCFSRRTLQWRRQLMSLIDPALLCEPVFIVVGCYCFVRVILFALVTRLYITPIC